MSLSNFTQGHLLKIKWLVADVTPVGFPDRAGRDILGMTLDINSGCYYGQETTL